MLCQCLDLYIQVGRLDPGPQVAIDYPVRGRSRRFKVTPSMDVPSLVASHRRESQEDKPGIQLKQLKHWGRLKKGELKTIWLQDYETIRLQD